MNAFNYGVNEAAPQEMRTPLIAIVALANEGDARLDHLGEVLKKYDLSIDKYSKLVV